MTLGFAIALVLDFDSAAPGLQHIVDESWIPDLGVRYALGVDGMFTNFPDRLGELVGGGWGPRDAARAWRRCSGRG